MNRVQMTALASVASGAAAIAFAQGPSNWSARLSGYQEVPALSNDAGGGFSASISPDDTTVSWELTYVATGTTQAHLHFGQPGVNGGITVFLCTNLNNGPTGTLLCPANGGTISGTFAAADVVAGAASQGIAAGELAEVIAAIRAGLVYANVHTMANPSGVVRGQLVPGQGHAH